MANSHNSKPETTWPDVAIRFIEAVIDRGSITALLITFVFIACMYVQFHRLESDAAKEVILYEFEVVQRPLYVAVAIYVAVSLWALRAQKKSLTREFKKLLPFRRGWMHYKRKCFDHIHKCMEDGTVVKYEDLENIFDHEMLDILHTSSKYDVGEK